MDLWKRQTKGSLNYLRGEEGRNRFSLHNKISIKVFPLLSLFGKQLLFLITKTMKMLTGSLRWNCTKNYKNDWQFYFIFIQ